MNNHLYKISWLLVMLGLSNVHAQSGMIDPGGSSYDIMEPIVRYSENWRFTMPDEGYVKFDVKGQDEVGIAFSDTPDEDLYYAKVLLGTEMNTAATVEYSDPNGDLVLVEEVYQEPSILNMAAPQSFWVTFNHGIITLGKGRELNQNVILMCDLNDYEDGYADLGVVYFSFASIAGAAYFENIEFGTLKTSGTETPADVQTAVTTATGTTMVRRTRTTPTTQQQRRTRRRIMKSRSRRAPLTKSAALQLRKGKKRNSGHGFTATPPQRGVARQSGRQNAPRRPIRVNQPQY